MVKIRGIKDMELDVSHFFTLEHGSFGRCKPNSYKLVKVEKVAHIEVHILNESQKGSKLLTLVVRPVQTHWSGATQRLPVPH